MPGYDNIVLTGLNFQDGIENPSGIQEDAFIIRVNDFATIAEPIANPTTPKALVEIEDDHVLKVGKTAIPVYTLFEKSGLESPMAGELFSKIFMPNATFFMPQITADAIGTVSLIKNMRLIVLVKRMSGGDFMQIGSKGLYAKLKEGSVKSGVGPTGEVGITFQLEAPSIHPFYIYKGAFPVPGT